MRTSALRVIALLILPGVASAAIAVYDITGTFSKTEQACTQITFLFGGKDCTYGRNRLAGGGGWLGPLFGGAHYNQDGTKDQVTYTPTFGDEQPPSSGTFVAAVDDGKIEAPITGTFSIDDNGTPGDSEDDLVSATFSIGRMARNITTGSFTRAVQRWTTMDHVIAPITVNSATSNANGGFDYVIGTRGFPAPLCNAANGSDCFPTPNASNDFAESTFWATITAGSVGIERDGQMGDPAFTLVQPPPSPPTGNVGAASTATFTGLTCSTNNGASDDCAVSMLVWGAGEDAGFDNIVMRISTNGAGGITSALAYWTQEYRIGFGGAPAGYDNSWQGGTFSFTAPAQSGPNARNFSTSVLQGSSGNTLDTVTNSVNFGGPVTVSIVTPPTLGTATVNGNNTLNYNSTGATGTDTIVYSATDGTDTDQGTITINVAVDTLPVAPDGAITISTQGAAPGAGTAGSVNVSTLATYSPGNPPSVVTITAPPNAAKGTAAVTGTTITFTPAATFFTGTDTIGYRITDSDNDPDIGVIAITITDIAPALANSNITTPQNTTSSALSLGITPGNGSVAQHTIVVSTAATSGTCAISGTSLTYTPNAGFFGTDSCVVTIADGDGDSDTGTINITVNIPDVLPVAPDDTIAVSTQGATPGTGTAGSVDISTVGGYLPGNVPSVVSIASPPASGTATVSGTTITFTPASSFFSGTTTIGYRITDSDLDFDGGVITVTIADLNPVIADGAITTPQDTVSSTLNLGITPGNGSIAQHTIVVSTGASSGTCTISGTSLTYTPNAGFFGTDSCGVRISDGDGDQDTGTINITVSEVDAIPNPFTFPDQNGVATTTLITSATVSVTGINHSAPISVVGGEYSIGCTSTFTATPSTISNGQTVCIRQTSSSANSTSTDSTLTIGGVADTFTTTTVEASRSGGGALDGFSLLALGLMGVMRRKLSS